MRRLQMPAGTVTLSSSASATTGGTGACCRFTAPLRVPAGTAIENPRARFSAWRYPRQYGPTSLTVTRAWITADTQLVLILRQRRRESYWLPRRIMTTRRGSSTRTPTNW